MAFFQVHRKSGQGREAAWTEGSEGTHTTLEREILSCIFVNIFTSEQLLQDLLRDGIYSCGTARKDHKGFPTTHPISLLRLESLGTRLGDNDN